ncbi:chorismate synthase [Clostridiaceae bacterium NSJ-31]|uniref:Chorismate synthase n=1 Tax=Ligaoa zhengdingensis TaxID=2763658 RepID=A0A926E0U3_9FIRM|nr:chorismate synthase [Ligaoa zhengdingensis]MBC8546989.1 chorismate synthase [Ligaoa zhengdingensis]
MSVWGRGTLNLSIFGESHGPGIGVVIDGLPAGEEIDVEELMAFCARRAPGRSSTATKRKEPDRPEFLSGLLDGRTTGAPLCAVIRNSDTHSGDYDNLRTTARPGHADYTAWLRFQGYNDVRGSGHFSGRLTAPLVVAGGIAKQILRRRGVEVGAHILSVHSIVDRAFDPVAVTAQTLRSVGEQTFPVLDKDAGERMIGAIEQAAAELNSLGGVVECCAVGFPAGVGTPMFDGLENSLSSILFGIPAVKGVEFGAGFDAAGLTGAENNDEFELQEGRVVTRTNHHGGILGGISSGMPITMRVAFKPTPSISRPQQTVNFQEGCACELVVKGRHDPCVVPRAVPCVEAAAAFALLSYLV